MNNLHGLIQLQGPFTAGSECLPSSLQSGNPMISKVSIALHDKWPLSYSIVEADGVVEKNIEDRVGVIIGSISGAKTFKIGQTGLLELDFDSIQSPISIKFDKQPPDSTLIDLFIRG